MNRLPETRLANTLSLFFRALEVNCILEAIGPEVAACHADSVKVSHVLRALAAPTEWAKGTLRLTTGRMTTAQEIDRAVAVIVAAVHEFRKI